MIVTYLPSETKINTHTHTHTQGKREKFSICLNYKISYTLFVRDILQWCSERWLSNKIDFKLNTLLWRRGHYMIKGRYDFGKTHTNIYEVKIINRNL